MENNNLVFKNLVEQLPDELVNKIYMMLPQHPLAEIFIQSKVYKDYIDLANRIHRNEDFGFYTYVKDKDYYEDW